MFLTYYHFLVSTKLDLVNKDGLICFCRLPSNFSTLEGAVIEPLAVALHGIRRSGVSGGDKVLITGAGIIIYHKNYRYL